MIVCIDGQVVAPAEATISIFDRGVLYGDGLFEVLRTWDGVAVHLDRHLARLFASAAALRMRTVERRMLRAWTEHAIAAAGGGDQRIRIVITRGPGALGQRSATLGPGRAIIVVEPLGPLPAEVSLAVVDLPLPRRVGPAHKMLAYSDHLRARDLAVEAGADDAVRLDADGNVAECATANIFLVEQGTVITPPVAGILPGITRARVLEACELSRIPTREDSVSPARLYAADEVFVTSAVRGVVPVTRLDGADRSAGPITTRIAAIIAPRPAI